LFISELRYQSNRVKSNDASQFKELNDIYSSFTAFKAGHERLMLAEPLREFGLRQFRVSSMFYEQLDQSLVASRVDRFRHEPPGRMEPAFQLVGEINYLKIR
jgi:hypothetical protein